MTLRMKTEMVFETLVPTKRNHLTRLIARKNFIISIETYSPEKHQIVSNRVKNYVNGLVARMRKRKKFVQNSSQKTLKDGATLKYQAKKGR
jgi:hypothetical protein